MRLAVREVVCARRSVRVAAAVDALAVLEEARGAILFAAPAGVARMVVAACRLQSRRVREDDAHPFRCDGAGVVTRGVDGALEERVDEAAVVRRVEVAVGRQQDRLSQCEALDALALDLAGRLEGVVARVAPPRRVDCGRLVGRHVEREGKARTRGWGEFVACESQAQRERWVCASEWLAVAQRVKAHGAACSVRVMRTRLARARGARSVAEAHRAAAKARHRRRTGRADESCFGGLHTGTSEASRSSRKKYNN